MVISMPNYQLEYLDGDFNGRIQDFETCKIAFLVILTQESGDFDANVFYGDFFSFYW